MKMKVSFGGHIWSMFQVVVLVVCLQENVSGEIAQGCIGSQLSLRCPEMKVIQITDVVLGDSKCYGASCCIKDDDCTNAANTNHRRDVHLACSNQRECSVQVIQEQINNCWSNNDFERITYNCLDDPRRSTTATRPSLNSTEDNLFTRRNPQKKKTENDGVTIPIDEQSTTDSFSHNAPVSVSSVILGIGIVGVVCLIITIGIVALVFIFGFRRKRRKQVRSTDEVGTIDRETDGYETIGINEARRICIETPVSEYCELDKVDRARVQLDSEYMQLQQVKSTDEAKKFDRETNRNEVTYINGTLETAESLYCELDAVPIDGVARESVQCGSEYLQLAP